MTMPVAPWHQARPVRNHNPGDLRPRGGHPPWPGQADIDKGPGGPFSIFLTDAEGWAALGLWTLYAHDVLGKRTAQAMIGVFAPPSENNTRAYIANVERQVGTGDLNVHDVKVRTAVCKAIARYEDSKAVWDEKVISGGMVLCDVHWPEFHDGHVEAAATSTAEALNQAQLDKLKPTGTTEVA